MNTQTWRLAGITTLLALFVGSIGLPPVAAAPTPATGRGGLRPEKRVVDAAFHGVSRPLRSVLPRAVDPSAPSAARRLQKRLVLPKSRRGLENSSRNAAIVQAVQPGAPMPAPETSFDGVGNVSGVLPPDTQGDVGNDPATGRKFYVQWVNLAFQIWDVTDPAAVASLYGPAAGNTLWAGTGTFCESHNDGDPITQFDHLANRWMMSQFALGFPSDFHQCIAVSATADPTGAWYLYDFQTSTTVMNDYPHFGVWPDGYYMSVNQFDGATYAYAGAGVAVFERAAMLGGLPARMIYLDLGEKTLDWSGMLPTDLDGPGPAAGTPNYFMEWDDSAWLGDPQDTLRVWEFRTDWSDVANTTFGSDADYAPNRTVATADVDPNLCGGARACIAQPGTSARLDAISDRLMYRLQYRDFGTHQVIVGNHTVDANGADRAGIHWFELRDNGAGWTMSQEGVYAPGVDGDSRWMGSAAMDASGDIALGYSVAGAGTYPSVRYAGRLEADPPGTLPQAEVSLVAGGGSQTSGYSRWGDYSMLALDAADGCTFWYTQEYYAATSSAGWKTRIGSFRFPSCTTAPTGTVTGTVTDGSTPIPGATVAAACGISTVAGADGRYQLRLAAGSHDLAVSAFGRLPAVAAAVPVAAGDDTPRDFTLGAAPGFTLAGTVTDRLTGWPLYARVEMAPGIPGGPRFTDPVTGGYSVDLPSGEYTITVRAMSGGYLDTVAPLAVAGAAVRDFALDPDATACSAPGYAYPTPFFSEEFETWPLAGWTVVNNAAGLIWRSNTDPAYADANYTGGAGHAATVDSDDHENVPYDTELRSPAIDPLGLSTLHLSYRANYQDLTAYDTLDLDISGDDGATWTNISRWTADRGRMRGTPGVTVAVDLTPYVAGPFRLRWHYYTSDTTPWDWYAQIDEVRVGSGCAPIASSGLLIGAVGDANTGAPVLDALVRDAALQAATTIDSSADPAAPPRMYVMGLPAGARTLTASASSYGADTRTPTAVAGATVRQDFLLPAGRLEAIPASLVFNVTVGSPASSATLTLANGGAVAATHAIFAFAGAAPANAPTGPFAAHTRHLGPKSLNDRDASKIRVDLTPRNVPVLPGGAVSASWSTGLAAAWGIGYDTDAGDLWVGNLASGGGDNRDHRFLTDGTATGDAIDMVPWVATFAADMTYNPFTRTLWQVNVGGDTCIHELDPAALAATGNKICPPFGTSERGLAFDPLSGTYYAGSWNDGIINHFAPDGTLLDSKAVDLDISGLAFNPSTRHLFVLANADAVANSSLFDVYVLDTADSYALLGGFNLASGAVRAFGNFQQAGLEIACDGTLWAVNQGTETVFAADSGETGVCDWQPGWIGVQPAAGTVGAGAAAGLTVSVSAAGLETGTYHAYLRVVTDTPYGNLIVPVTLNYTVDPPAPPPPPPTVSLAIASLGVNDGWILESAERSGKGGKLNRTARTFLLGDDAADRQYRAVLHFDTSALPDNAVITAATVRIFKRGRKGTDPFTTHGDLVIDIAAGHFGATPGLAKNDFGARAGKTAVARFGAAPAGNWYSATLSADAMPFVSATGTTQLRLRFDRDDNDDRGADFAIFSSGGGAAAEQPQLVVEYHVP